LPIINNELPNLELITKHPITPSEAELEYNNRAHSAKMRVAKKN
ncbi:MAG: 16S rRNA (cytosine(1402)-N(4))-methyltransferase, partial [bacterium]|nr:16S rRNA (cytosine(1402)-N(4))-methyltransferase [bacterium]